MAEAVAVETDVVAGVACSGGVAVIEAELIVGIGAIVGVGTTVGVADDAVVIDSVGDPNKRGTVGVRKRAMTATVGLGAMVWFEAPAPAPASMVPKRVASKILVRIIKSAQPVIANQMTERLRLSAAFFVGSPKACIRKTGIDCGDH